MDAGPFPIKEATGESAKQTRLPKTGNAFAISSSRRYFQVIPEDDLSLESFNPPERNYECPNYETCLGLAAALNWKSFTCLQCSGEVNQQLLWRAHHKIRNNPSLSKLCGLPTLASPEEV